MRRVRAPGPLMTPPKSPLPMLAVSPAPMFTVPPVPFSEAMLDDVPVRLIVPLVRSSTALGASWPMSIAPPPLIAVAPEKL